MINEMSLEHMTFFIQHHINL